MPYDFSYTQNRELSWLMFDERILQESTEKNVPLFERLKFVSIFTSNLDEFFMVRVGGLSDLSTLKVEPVDNKSNQTPSQQLSAIFASIPRLFKMRTKSFREIEAQLKPYGIERLSADELEGKDLEFIDDYVKNYLYPILNPQIIDPRHPFPNLRNLGLYCVYTFKNDTNKGESTDLLGMVEVPSSEPRIIYLPSEKGEIRFVLLEDAMLACAHKSFGSYQVKEHAIIRVTRNADIDPDEEVYEDEDNFRQHMKRVLKKRLRLQPVRLEVQGSLSDAKVKFIRKTLELGNDQVFYSEVPVDMGYIWEIEDQIPEISAEELLHKPFSPQPSTEFDPSRSLMQQVYEEDKMLWFPYESMSPFLELIHEAAYDPNVISIKITLYRIAKKSKLAESLIAAAENGKEVTVLMELRARFDEENNIIWAERLEDAGCTVVYGQEGFKVHSKICQITSRINGEISRITQFGTGNYNEKTASLYSDVSFMTAHKGICDDANVFFRNMSLGNLNGSYEYLGVAPTSLKPLIISHMEKEMEKARRGEVGKLIFKMNSLTDREIIDKLAEASQAGVKVFLIIRGICCLLPGIQNKTDNIEIKGIAGRFLEHARIYCFGENMDTIFCSSADMMTRNTEHRVEICFPILEDRIKEKIQNILKAQLNDNVKARLIDSNGVYQRVPREPGEEDFVSQKYFMDKAIEAAQTYNLTNDQMEAARRNQTRKSMYIGPKVAVPQYEPQNPMVIKADEEDLEVSSAPQSLTSFKHRDFVPSEEEVSAQETSSEQTKTTIVEEDENMGRFELFAKYLGMAFKALFK